MLGQDYKLIKKALNQKQHKFINLPLSIFYRGGVSTKTPDSRKNFFKMLKDRLKNLQIYSLITLLMKYFFLKDPIYLERVIYFRNKFMKKMFSYVNFLK